MTGSGADALVDRLVRGGVRHLFGVPGVQLDHVLDALIRSRSPIRYLTARHEQGAAHMAEGYARTTGRPGVCLVVPGPGVLNALTAIATGYACSSPLVCLAADIPTPWLDRNLGILHEVPHQHQMLAAVTKWSIRVSRADEIPAAIDEALRRAVSDRPRPVAVSIPADLLSAPLGSAGGMVAPAGTTAAAGAVLSPGGTGPDGFSARRGAAAADPADLTVAQLADVLRRARRPAFYAGGGVQTVEAAQALVRLATSLNAPVVMSRHGGGSIRPDHPLAFSSLAAPAILGAADVVVAVGSRFITPRGAPVPIAPGATLVLINADPADLGQPRTPHLALLGDARTRLEELAEELGGERAGELGGELAGHPLGPQVDGTGGSSGWQAGQLAGIRRGCADRVAAVQPQWSFVQALREAIPEDGILVNELTQVGYLASVGYPVYGPRTFLDAGYQGTLGYGYPTALGAKTGNPDRAVVSISGDGGFCWNLQELATAARYGLGVTAVVFNDNAFGNVKRIQADEFGGRMIGWDLAPVDFVALAEAFGIPGLRVEAPADLAAAIKSSLSEPRGVVIEVPVTDMPSAWPLLLGGTPGSVRN